MKNTIIWMIMILSSLPAIAGFQSKLPVKWGKVSAVEFDIVPMGADANADAVILCDYGKIEITNRTFYTRHTRVKILNNSGLKYASVEIPYQTRNRHDVFYDLKAHTLVMENGKIVKHKVEPSQIENIKVNEQWSKKKFTFPAAVPGAIIEYKYQIASLDFEKLDTWYFQHEIPILWSEIRFEIPQPFIYLVTYDNNRELQPDEEAAFGEKLQWMYNTRDRTRHFELANANYLLYNTGENRLKVWAINDYRKKIVMKNLPGLSSHTEKESLSELYPQVRFDLFESSGNLPRMFRPLLLTTKSEYENKSEWSVLHDPSVFIGYVHFRMKTWQQYAENLLSDERFGGFLNKSAGNLNALPVNMEADELKRISDILRYVRNNFKWNGEYSMYTEHKFREFLETKTGSSAELNLLLVNLFRQYGIRSNPVLIKTSGIPEKMYPVKNQFNHVVAAAEIGGKPFLFDVTGNGPSINEMTKLDLDTYGFMVDIQNYGWIVTCTEEDSETMPVIRL